MVLEAGTILDAERLVERHSGPVDVLVVEAVLSTTNGIDMAKRLHVRYPKLPVLFISERAAEELRNEGLVPEGAHFWSKHAGAEELRRQLRELMGIKTSAAVAGADTAAVRSRISQPGISKGDL